MAFELFYEDKLLVSFLVDLFDEFCMFEGVLLMMLLIWGRLDSVISGYYAMISVMSSSTSVYLERLSRSIHFDSTSPLLLTYSSVMPGG